MPEVFGCVPYVACIYLQTAKHCTVYGYHTQWCGDSRSLDSTQTLHVNGCSHPATRDLPTQDLGMYCNLRGMRVMGQTLLYT